MSEGFRPYKVTAPAERTVTTERPESGVEYNEMLVKDAQRVIELLGEARSYAAVLARGSEQPAAEAIDELASELMKTHYFSADSLELVKNRVSQLFTDYSFDRKIAEYENYKAVAEDRLSRLGPA